jgi:cation diffusion facilitator CzcD-associated flavoprotein CzcO
LKAIQPIAGHVSVFIRQPTWVLGPFGEAQRSYEPEELQRFKDDPNFLIKKRKMFESRVNSYFSFCLKSSTQQAQIRTHLAEEMRSKLRKSGNEELNENSVIPSYAVGCRRPTPGVGYVESITSPNVSLIVGHIEKATKTGFVDNKLREHEADILICATGFDTSHRPPFTIHGLDGKDLQEQWKDQASAYLALAVPHMPNYFLFYGPNNPFGSGAFLSTIGKVSRSTSLRPKFICALR